MHFVKKSVVIICLIAFAISTSGISMQMHSCRMAGTTKVAFFPEIFGSTTSCCEMPAASNSNDACAFGKVPCCKNENKFAKIATIFNYQFSSNNLTKLVLNIASFALFNYSVVEVQYISALSEYRPPPLQLFGIKLLHFIKNIKTDLPS